MGLTAPHGWSLSRFLWHEATRSIATPPRPPPTGWDGSPSQGHPQQYVTDTRLYTRPLLFKERITLSSG